MPLLVGLLFIQGFGVHAQTGVMNGGFEAFFQLPSATGQFELVADWRNGGSDVAIPDFYHEMGSNGGDLPQTPLAKVDPFNGRAIAGFVAYTEEENPRHEYVSGSFLNPLTEGKRYKMTFAITSGRVHDWVEAGIGVSGLGMVLTTSPPAQEGHERLTKTPHFQIHETLYDRYWREFSFVFTATDAFTTFTLGLFGEETRVRREEGDGRTMAYYFVDDFRLVEVDDFFMSAERPDRGMPGEVIPEGAYIPNAFSPNGDSVNDTWDWSLPAEVDGTLEVFDRWGNMIAIREVDKNEGEAWDGKDNVGNVCLPGVYGWRFSTNEPWNGQTEWKGWVTLIR